MAHMNKENKYYTRAAARIVGVPHRTLQDWAVKGFLDVPTRGPGDRREFGYLDLYQARVVKSLKAQAIPADVIKPTMEQMRGLWNLENLVENHYVAFLIIRVNEKWTFCAGYHKDEERLADHDFYKIITEPSVEKTLVINLTKAVDIKGLSERVKNKTPIVW